MGRPLNKRYFGSGAGAQLKVRAKIGTAAEGDGIIVKQRGTAKFRVTVGSDTGDCYLVDKADGTLAANEMTVTVMTDAGVLARATKLYNRVAVVNGSKVPWNFATSLTDGAVTPEEVETGIVPVIRITAQPASVTVQQPDAATFTVTADVVPAGSVAYQWQSSDDLGATWSNIPATTNSLTVSPTSNEITGTQYRVILSSTGAASVTSAAAALIVTA